MTIKNIRSGVVALLIGAMIATSIFFLVLLSRGPDVLIITGVPLTKLVKVFIPHALEAGSGANSEDACSFFRIAFNCGGRERLYVLCAWIQFSVYFWLIANQLLTRLALHRQASLTANETVAGEWLRPSDGSSTGEGSSQSSQTAHRSLRLVGGILMTSVGVGLLYVASLFGLSGRAQLAEVPGLIFIWIGLFFLLAKKGWALALLSVASVLMLGFVVLEWIVFRTVLI